MFHLSKKKVESYLKAFWVKNVVRFRGNTLRNFKRYKRGKCRNRQKLLKVAVGGRWIGVAETTGNKCKGITDLTCGNCELKE